MCDNVIGYYCLVYSTCLGLTSCRFAAVCVTELLNNAYWSVASHNRRNVNIKGPLLGRVLKSGNPSDCLIARQASVNRILSILLRFFDTFYLFRGSSAPTCALVAQWKPLLRKLGHGASSPVPANPLV